MNYIKHLTGFFNCISSEDILYPTHISLYLALFQSWNVNRFKNPITISREEMMKAYSIQSEDECLSKKNVGLCVIEKELTFHITRHTFATIVTLTNGVPIESVSKILGHKNLRTAQHYAKVLDRKVSDDMKMLKDKYSNSIEKKKFSS